MKSIARITVQLLTFLVLWSGAQAVLALDTAIEQDLDKDIQSQRQDLTNGIEEERRDLDRGVEPTGPNGQNSDPRAVANSLKSLGYQLWYPVPTAPVNPPNP